MDQRIDYKTAAPGAFKAMLGLETYVPVSYTHLRAHETVLDLVCRLLLEKKRKTRKKKKTVKCDETRNTTHGEDRSHDSKRRCEPKQWGDTRST